MDTSRPQVGYFKVVDLDNAPPYYALSHSWGAQDQETAILVGDQTFWVCSDLAAGIERLRQLAKENSIWDPPIEHIWIDTISINQADILERSSQVEHMGDIYSRAIGTLIWLGPEFEASSVAWQLVDDIYGVFRKQHPTATVLEDIPIKKYSDSSHAASELPDWTSEKWSALKQLFKLRWFSRIWVLQEVVLSRRDPVIIHGQHLFPWHRLEWASSWMRRNGYVPLAQVPEEILNVDAIGLLRRSQEKWPLDGLMSITQFKFHAKDQRDKVYGLLGLAAETCDSSKIPDDLVPDYAIGVKQTYQRVTRYVLEHSRSLAALTRARGTSGSTCRRRRQYDLKDFPSWLPDWSDFTVYNRDLRRSLAWLDYSDVSKPPHMEFPPHYNASAGCELRVRQTTDDSILHADGIQVDQVVRVVAMNDEDVLNSEFNQSFEPTMTRVCEAALALLAEKEVSSWASHFIKATTAEQYRLGGREWDQFFKDGVAFLYKLLLVHPDLMSQFTRRTGDETAMEELQHLSAGGEAEEYAAVARNYCFNRSFIVTSVGRMGIGPSNTGVGDTIAVICGSGLPFVIAPQESSWVLVGESYVHGIMNGEAVEACRRGLLQQQILEIL